MIRTGRKYTPEEILPLVEFTESGQKLSEKAIFLRGGRRELDGDPINFASSRLQTFALKGISCVTCGIIGEFFIKEKHSNREKYYHLGFYALSGDDKWILMTKDHILPKSKGGKDHIDNYQTMCSPCNGAKGNDPTK